MASLSVVNGYFPDDICLDNLEEYMDDEWASVIHSKLSWEADEKGNIPPYKIVYELLHSVLGLSDEDSMSAVDAIESLYDIH